MKLCAPTTRLHADSQANNSSIFGVFTGKLNRLIMKKFLFPLMLLAGLLIAPSLSAQRIAIVDITRVLEEMPDYQAAQQELDNIAATWRQEIAKEYDQIKAMYNKYQAEQVLLTEDARRKKEEEIMEREKQVREMQREKFGPEGALFRKRQDLVQPIQERVYGAIKTYAEDRGYDFIFDKGGTSGLIFSNAEFDKTEDIIRVVTK